MNSCFLIWGSSGHAKVVLDVARSAGSFDLIHFIDDDPKRAGLPFCGCTLLGGVEELDRLAGSSFIIAIGDNRARSRCFGRALDHGLTPSSLIHSNAVVAPSACIGKGTVVMAGAIVNAGAVVGENCILNSGAIVEHDCRVGAHVHISPRAVLGGGASVGSFAHIGIGAILLPGVSVGEESVVGAGAVVLRDVPARCTVAGVPAKALHLGFSPKSL
jgi:sugar O-acyltransferase (sialic acid O-acetyltransferase NeuD family)